MCKSKHQNLLFYLFWFCHMKGKTMISQNMGFFIQLFLGNIKALTESKNQKWKEKSKLCNSLNSTMALFHLHLIYFHFWVYLQSVEYLLMTMIISAGSSTAGSHRGQEQTELCSGWRQSSQCKAGKPYCSALELIHLAS